jgi:hypothetical protein
MNFPYMVRQNLVIMDITAPHFVCGSDNIIDLTLTIADADRGLIEIPFSAHADDTEEHGREIHAYALTLNPTPWAGLSVEQNKDLIATKRWEVETGGLYLNGMFVNTEDRSKTLLNGSAIKAMRNPAYVLRWKTPTGFIDLPSEQVLYIADAVADFVQDCFDREDELLAALEAGTFTEAMLAEGWPSNGTIPNDA